MVLHDTVSVRVRIRAGSSDRVVNLMVVSKAGKERLRHSRQIQGDHTDVEESLRARARIWERDESTLRA